MRTLRAVALLTFVLSFSVVDAHATILGDILTKIDNLKTLMPSPTNAASFINNYIKTNRLNTGKLLVQVWRGSANDIIKDIDAATALGLNTAPLMQELVEGPIAAIIIMEDTLVADDLGLTNAINVLTARSRYYRNGMQTANDELHIVYDLGNSMDWYQWYLWLWYYGGIEYYIEINNQNAYYTGYYYDAIVLGMNDYLSPYHPDDYMMPLSEFYGNVQQGLELYNANEVLFQIIDNWIAISRSDPTIQAVNTLSYWLSMGATLNGTVLNYGPVITVDERWIQMPENLWRGYYCYTSYDSPDYGRTWYQDDQIYCEIFG